MRCAPAIDFTSDPLVIGELVNRASRSLGPLGWEALDIRLRLPDHKGQGCVGHRTGSPTACLGLLSPRAVRGGSTGAYRRLRDQRKQVSTARENALLAHTAQISQFSRICATLRTECCTTPTVLISVLKRRSTYQGEAKYLKSMVDALGLEPRTR